MLSIRSIVALGVSYLAATAVADINGFGFLLPSEWQLNVPDGGSQPQAVEEGRIRFTSNNQNEQHRSVFYRTQQSVTRFQASFVYQPTDMDPGEDGGLTFIMHRDAITNCGGYRGRLGYVDGGFGHSVGLTMRLCCSLSGLYRDGSVGDGGEPIAPIDLSLGHHYRVDLDYDGQLLRVTFTDVETNDTFVVPPYPINIPAEVGGSTAYIGFSAATYFGVYQYLSDFHFTSDDPPCAMPQQGDLDGDGDVDLQDLAVMLANFGIGCP